VCNPACLFQSRSWRRRVVDGGVGTILYVHRVALLALLFSIGMTFQFLVREHTVARRAQRAANSLMLNPRATHPQGCILWNNWWPLLTGTLRQRLLPRELGGGEDFWR